MVSTSANLKMEGPSLLDVVSTMYVISSENASVEVLGTVSQCVSEPSLSLLYSPTKHVEWYLSSCAIASPPLSLAISVSSFKVWA